MPRFQAPPCETGRDSQLASASRRRICQSTSGVCLLYFDVTVPVPVSLTRNVLFSSKINVPKLRAKPLKNFIQTFHGLLVPQ
ncbi:hypothetical protein HUJ05_012596 [Dendroctonus ponderosae]|nr:hypothetical protein HUJ05_012596 [Dendroctonus ponderosae]